MDRRNFFKILSATSAGAMGGCGKKADKLIPLLVPEHEVVPGLEQWRPAVCVECAAGCGTLVRIMEGVRTVERNGEPFRERIAAVKKIEGNPLDPISGGRLCARGQASVQSLYHPDRLRGPMRRSGQRGQARFAPVSWEEALSQAAEQLAKARSADPAQIIFFTAPQRGTRFLAIQQFMQALGAPAPVTCSLAGHAVERKAAELVFGWRGLPVYDIARAQAVLSVGADFLGGWASPVYYARQFGAFRQGRREIRGQLVHAESRLSITAAVADRWLPLRPGSELQFLAAIGHLLLETGLARNADALPKAAAAAFRAADPGALLASCGLEEKRVRQVVQEFGESEHPLVVAGASVVHTNSLDAIVASHYVNLMLGAVGKPGGVLAPAPALFEPESAPAVAEALARARVILMDGANPVYTLPRSSGVADVLARAELTLAFGSFLDDSAAWADFLLPGHHVLESDLAIAPAVAAQPSVALAAPLVEPLYETRPVEMTLSQLARKLGVSYHPVTSKDWVQPLLNGMNEEDAARQGGFWLDPPAPTPPRPNTVPLELSAARFEGDPGQYPYYFQPYLSLQFHEGSGANLPWLQELPDPASSSIWGLPVEIDPQTARKLGVSNGDRIRVESPHGALEAPAYVHPGAIPGVASMAIGDGHSHYTRYASGRGANPLAILAPVWEKSTGTLALGATRVRITRAGGPRNWIQFSAQDRPERGFSYR
jgi:anaerobic selenocysteine-containing dehydrogenase